MLTNIFPIPGIDLVNSTSVCYYFAKEWVKLGYEVTVVYNYAIYTPILHWLAYFFEKQISSHFPTVINKKRFTKIKRYELDGIKVILMPCYKIVPKISYPLQTIERQVRSIQGEVFDKGFIPDIIAGHFLHPTLEIVTRLKALYNVRAAIILHGEIFSKCDISSIQHLKDNIDIWGYRSYPIRKSFENSIGSDVVSFMCLSGVPENYISTESYQKVEKNEVENFIYVGSLIKRKHPIKIIDALHRVYGNDYFRLTVVGTGNEKQKMLNFAVRLGLKEYVRFLGRLPRDRVKEELLQSECFIMISEAETFGLVYLEAMANGCIVIASKDEGMDNIIKDGYNGFLCRAGDAKDLAMVISKVRQLSNKEKVRISQRAINTVLHMTDTQMAQKYIESILSD